MINNTLCPTPATHASVPTNSRTDLSSAFAPAALAPTPPVSPLRAVSYCRVSSETQREKETVKTQIELNEKFCVANGYTLVETYVDDGVSGTTHLQDRPAGSRLLLDARAGKFDAVVVYKADRLGRSALVNETLALELHGKLGVAIVGVAEQIDLSSPIGAAMFTFQSAIGRLERENTLQRSRDATLRLAREGAWLGGICPFGYRVEGKERSARLAISDQKIPGLEMSEADVVRMIYTMAGEEGKSSIQIAEHLNELQIPTSYARDGREVVRNKRKEKTQELWRPGRIRNMLVESTYKGVHVWGKRSKTKAGAGEAKSTIERAVPAIVDAKLWDAAQLTLRRNRFSRPDIDKRPYLLRGLMKCAHCGLTYIGTVSDGKRVGLAKPHELTNLEVRGDLILRPYYLCNGANAQHRASPTKCPSGYVRAKELESLVWREIEGFLCDPDAVIQELRAQLNARAVNCGAETELKELLAKQAAADAERATLYRLFRRGGISEGDLNAQLDELLAEEKTLSAGVERLELEVTKARDADALLQGARELLETLKAKLDADDSWASKRQIVEALVAGVEVDSLFDPAAKRGRMRKTSLRIAYRFEVPSLEDAAPRTAKTPLPPSGLMLQRAHKDVTLLAGALDEAKAAAKSLLQKNPKRLGTEVVATLQQSGLQISKASVSRLRSGLKAASAKDAA